VNHRDRHRHASRTSETPGRRPACRPAARAQPQHADPQHASAPAPSSAAVARWASESSTGAGPAHTQRISAAAPRGGVGELGRGSSDRRLGQDRPFSSSDAAARRHRDPLHRCCRPYSRSLGAQRAERGQQRQVARAVRYAAQVTGPWCRAIQPVSAVVRWVLPPTVHRRSRAPPPPRRRRDEVQGEEDRPADASRSARGTWSSRCSSYAPFPACPARSAEPYFGSVGIPEAMGQRIDRELSFHGEHLRLVDIAPPERPIRRRTSLVREGGWSA